MRQKHNLFTEVGFARPGASVDKKVSLVLATMCSNTRIEIMIKHSFKSPETNKARGQLDSDEAFHEGCRNYSFYFHQQFFSAEKLHNPIISLGSNHY